MGVVIGLLVGVGLALLVAWYLTRSQPQEKPGIRAQSNSANYGIGGSCKWLCG